MNWSLNTVNALVKVWGDFRNNEHLVRLEEKPLCAGTELAVREIPAIYSSVWKWPCCLHDMRHTISYLCSEIGCFTLHEHGKLGFIQAMAAVEPWRLPASPPSCLSQQLFKTKRCFYIFLAKWHGLHLNTSQDKREVSIPGYSNNTLITSPTLFSCAIATTHMQRLCACVCDTLHKKKFALSRLHWWGFSYASTSQYAALKQQRLRKH